MLLVNTIFIALIGFSYSNEFNGSILALPLFKIISPILGLVLCYLWLRMTEKGFIWMNHWIFEARKIENQLKSEINPVKAGEELRLKIGGGVTKNASFLVIGIIAFVYLLLLISNIVK